MPHIDYSSRQVAFKLVYFGPGMSGKTTNLVEIHRRLNPTARGELVSLDTDDERTLFFDFFPLDLGNIMGFHLRFNLYTVPGQIHYEATRRLLLDGADGIVFVVDSQPERAGDNLQSFEMLLGNLEERRLAIAEFPCVVQYNKRDCPNPVPIGQVERRLGHPELAAYEAVALDGRGVMETVGALSRQVIERFEV